MVSMKCRSPHLAAPRYSIRERVFTVNHPKPSISTTPQTDVNETGHRQNKPGSRQKPKTAISEARLRANRENAKSSTGPKTHQGKKRSSLNAMRHGLLAQTIHLPEEEMQAFTVFTATYVAGLSPVGSLETQLANACADLQFRLHRLAAAEHNLFAIGHDENGDKWIVENSESHSALTFAETLRRGKDPLATLSLYEARLSRRFLQTLKQLREIQAERQSLEQQHLKEMCEIAAQHPVGAENLDPRDFGFVCSAQQWHFFHKRLPFRSITRDGRSRILKYRNGYKAPAHVA
jgi:hypothetical protein